MDLIARLLGTIANRPYVFVFLAIYLVAAVTRLGWRRTAVFSVVAYGVAFAAEFSSTRNGFPFGLYHYVDTMRDRELWIGNVPFWDSLSFTFLCYLGWRLGVLLYVPLAVGRGDFQVVETRAIARSWRVCLTGALLMTWLDVVIDPLTVRGERWFLGRIYHYPEGGLYFGVPLSNFAGWFLVGATAIGVHQTLEDLAWCRRGRRGVRHVPYGGVLEPLLYVGILAFNLTLTLAIGEPLLATIGLAIFLPILVLGLAHPLNPQRHATAADVAAHLRDYPASPLRARGLGDDPG